MKRILLLPLMFALLFGVAWPRGAAAAVLVEPVPVAKNEAPGVALAQAVSTITGVAISPLFGAGAVGAWKYYKAPAVLRGKLPWFAQPWFWVPALIIVGICALKDVFGLAIPAPLKKPFDVLETLQHKVSALILIGAFVPLVATVFRSTAGSVPASLNTAFAGHGFIAAINPAWLYNGVAVLSLVFVFFIVFLASNAINILILLSPFPILDAALKLFRLFVLGTIVLSAFINPWLGAVWSVGIILLASLIAGWSFRVSHFGLTFLWDFLTRRSRRFVPDSNANAMFLGRKINGVPTRTYGKLMLDQHGDLLFAYHPWLVLPRRVLHFPRGVYASGQGLLYSEILKVEGGQGRTILLLPPRYRGHEKELAAIYGFAGVRPSGLLAVAMWLNEWLGLRPRPPLIAA